MQGLHNCFNSNKKKPNLVCMVNLQEQLKYDNKQHLLEPDEQLKTILTRPLTFGRM